VVHDFAGLIRETQRHCSGRSLTSLQPLVKTRGRTIKHARYYWLLLADGHLTRWLFGGMLRRSRRCRRQRDRQLAERSKSRRGDREAKG